MLEINVFAGIATTPEIILLFPVPNIKKISNNITKMINI